MTGRGFPNNLRHFPTLAQGLLFRAGEDKEPSAECPNLILQAELGDGVVISRIDSPSLTVDLEAKNTRVIRYDASTDNFVLVS